MTKVRKQRIIITLILLICIVLTACGSEYPEYVLGMQNETETEVKTQDSTTEPYNTTKQLTADDIMKMNEGNALFAYSKDGFLTTLVGKYYDKKVADYEEAITSLNGVASLIGLTKGSEFFCVYGETDDNGYTYYTYQQRYGDNTLQNATLRIIIDPEGYTAGLSCSFTPNVGIAQKEEAISQQEAEEVVQNQCADLGLEIYSDYTDKLSITYENATLNCYVVYTNNPDASVSFDMMYLEHFVTYKGEYVIGLPTASLSTEKEDTYKTESYFENLKQTTYKGNVTLFDGTVKEVTIPVAYNEQDGKYYLADVERKIIVGDFYSFIYHNELQFESNTENDGWDNNHLLAYMNYITAYDFYKKFGIESIDGFGNPILILTGFCDENGTSVDNACFCGNKAGWSCFGVSDINRYSQGLDVVVHEFTHGVTQTSMRGLIYANDTGAISEAYSDIMGNLAEMSMGATADTSWLVGECCGSIARCMSNPLSYNQPEYIGDANYVPISLYPCSTNDNGGVHTNNSLISQIAYDLYIDGMSYAEECSLWITSMELMTPLSGYNDLYTCLLFSARINGMEKYSDSITNAFQKAGLLDNRAQMETTANRDGYGRILFHVPQELANGPHFIQLVDKSTMKTAGFTYPDETGTVSLLVPEGEYSIVFVYISKEGNACYWYQGQTWEVANDGAIVCILAGETVTLNDLQ